MPHLILHGISIMPDFAGLEFSIRLIGKKNFVYNRGEKISMWDESRYGRWKYAKYQNNKGHFKISKRVHFQVPLSAGPKFFI